MIDPADKQTAALPLEEQPVKRGRGRPATGKAMTPAEKQRAYRERLKAKQAEQNSWGMAESLRMEVLRLEKELANAMKKIEKLKNGNVAEIPYEVQYKMPGKRSWKTIGENEPEDMPFRNWQEAESFAKRAIEDGSTFAYRIVPAYLPVKEYR